MGKRPIKYKKHPIKGCYKMNKKDKLRAEIIVEPEGLWLRKRLCIGSSMIYEEASRISGMNYQSLRKKFIKGVDFSKMIAYHYTCKVD